MMGQFISEVVEVKIGSKDKRPLLFNWQGKEYKILEVVSVWRDWGFGRGSPRKRSWRLRRHRNYYRVITDAGKTFELYLDRGGNARKWVLYREL